MNRSTKKNFLNVLAVSMLLIVMSLMVITSNNQNKDDLLNDDGAWEKMRGIQNGAQSFLQMVLNKLQVDQSCERDDIMEMSEYLDFRRTCLLRYCGDVCTTKQENDKGKVHMLFSTQTI